MLASAINATFPPCRHQLAFPCSKRPRRTPAIAQTRYRLEPLGLQVVSELDALRQPVRYLRSAHQHRPVRRAVTCGIGCDLAPHVVAKNLPSASLSPSLSIGNGFPRKKSGMNTFVGLVSSRCDANRSEPCPAQHSTHGVGASSHAGSFPCLSDELGGRTHQKPNMSYMTTRAWLATSGPVSPSALSRRRRERCAPRRLSRSRQWTRSGLCIRSLSGERRGAGRVVGKGWRCFVVDSIRSLLVLSAQEGLMGALSGQCEGDFPHPKPSCQC